MSQPLQAGPGAIGSRMGAVGRAHSAALCWAGKADAEESGFVAVITSQASLVRKLLNAKASCQHDNHCPTFMPVIYQLQHMGVLCGIQLTFGNALMYE